MKSLICLRFQLVCIVFSLEILQTYLFDHILIEFTRVHLKGTVAYFNTNIHWQMPLDVRGLMPNLFRREIFNEGLFVYCEYRGKYK
jgi:hypothetical protein